MPIWSGLAPAFSSFVVIFSTFAASVLRKPGVQFPGSTCGRLRLWKGHEQLRPQWGHNLNQGSHMGQKKLTTHGHRKNLAQHKNDDKGGGNTLWAEEPEQNGVRRAVSACLINQQLGLAPPQRASLCLPIQVRGTRTGDLFLALGHVEEHRLIRLWPLEVKPFLYTFRCHREGKSGNTSSQRRKA